VKPSTAGTSKSNSPATSGAGSVAGDGEGAVVTADAVVGLAGSALVPGDGVAPDVATVESLPA
jgi:hypothetical protein